MVGFRILVRGRGRREGTTVLGEIIVVLNMSFILNGFRYVVNRKC